MSEQDLTEPHEGAAAEPTPEAQEQAPETSDAVTRVAQAMGWSAKDKWKGRPEAWVDAEAFLMAQPKRLKNMQDQVETVARTADKMMAQQRKTLEKQIRAELAEATEAGDAAAVQDAAERLAEVRAPRVDPQEVQRDFAKANPWFGKNRAATALAREAAGELAAQGVDDPKRQLEAAEKAVRDEFPELFDDEAREDRPSRTSPSKSAPHTEGGQRTASATPREKGWADMPGNVRAVWTAKRLAFWGLPEGKAGQDAVAKTYWAEQEKGR